MNNSTNPNSITLLHHFQPRFCRLRRSELRASRVRVAWYARMQQRGYFEKFEKNNEGGISWKLDKALKTNKPKKESWYSNISFLRIG